MKKKYAIIILLSLVLSQTLFSKIAYIVDWPGSLDACVGDYDDAYRCSYDTLAVKNILQKYHFDVNQVSQFNEITTKPDLIVWFDSNRIQDWCCKKFPGVIQVMVIREPPALMPNNFDRKLHACIDYVFTWHDDFIDNQKYFKQHYVIWGPMVNNLVDFDQRKLCIMVTSNKASIHPLELYSQRKKVIDFFERYHPQDFDLYGTLWEDSKYAHYKVFKGEIPFIGSKSGGNLDHFRRYKFCICFENTRDIPGYITERIFDAFRSGCIPIYWGASNIEQYVPKNCFIPFSQFKNYREMYQFMRNMGREEYETYLKNIKAFLESDQSKKFTQQNFENSFEVIIKRVEQTLAQKNVQAQRGGAGACDEDINAVLPLDSSVQKDPQFVIISASYNNKEWYQKSLDSIFAQTYPWRLVYIDDASRDGTADLVEQYIQSHNMQDRVKLIKNKVHKGKLANVYAAIHDCQPDDIIVMLDADDWFYDNSVLEYVSKMYQDPDVWLTYGQYVVWPKPNTGCRELPHHVVAQNSMRYYDFVTSHLKTFYAGLFQKINRNDLRMNGFFMPLIDDVAYMIPMLEMAGEHSRFIPKVLYVFNQSSSQNHIQRHRKIGTADLFGQAHAYIRSIKPYAQIESPF